jgi:arylsulfatase A-like enzyme
MTTCPATRCSVPPLLTGRYATALEGAAEVPTLASTLAGAGWRTASITCCDRFTRDDPELAGFELVDASADAQRQSRAGQSNADVVVDKAVRWLARQAGGSGVGAGEPRPPFFLWMHLYDPHAPYQAPRQAGRFGDTDSDRYDAEVAFADEELGRLFYELARLGLAERTIVVVTSDHGEELGEHGIRFHARSLFNQVARIPLLVHVPAALGGRASVEEAAVSLADVTPTVLELAGVTRPAGMNGRSLAAVARGAGAAPGRPVLVELAPDRQIERDMAAIAWDGWKAIWDRQANSWSLFSLADDPGDERDLVDDSTVERRKKLAELRRALAEAIDAELGVLPAP